MRALAAFTLSLLFAGGCQTKACKDGTFLSFRGAAGADQLEVAVTVVVVGGATATSTVPVSSDGGSLEIFFAHYPSQESVFVRLTAERSGAPIAAQSGAVTLSGACGTLALTLQPIGNFDLGDGAVDGPPGDLVDMTDCTLASGASVWVDPENGSDDAQHGGAAGGCAFRSIGYALTKATKMINLAFANYSGETLPLSLSGTQGIDCDPHATGSRATISGAAPGPGVISLNGSQNIIRNCILDALTTTGGNCVTINSAAFPPHQITNSEIKNCYDNGIILSASGDNLTLANCNIHDTANGIWWDTTNATGVMTNNAFSSNAFNDIQCTAPDANVTGNGNHNGAAPPTCKACDNCTFQ